jgi:hypothetical protein
MSQTGISFGVSGTALVRAADAMLRALGGDEVSLLFPQAPTPDDTSSQLGLVDPGVEEVRISPVVVRNLPAGNSGPRRRLEFLFAASAVAATAIEHNAASAQTFLDSSLGVLYQGELFHIEGTTTEYFAGTAYLYRVVGVE